MLCDSTELQFSRVPQPESVKCAGAQRGALRRLRCPCRVPVRSDAVLPTLVESALAPRSTAFNERGETSDGRAICRVPPGLADVPGAPGSAAMPAECNFASSSGDLCELQCPVGKETLSISTDFSARCVPLHVQPAFCVGTSLKDSAQVTAVHAA